MRFTLVSLGLDRAQFLGVDWLLEHVKGVAHAHIRADEVVETEPPHVAFDLEHGGLEQALSSGVLPARFFGPAKTGSKRVKQTIPAGEHDAIMFDSRTPAGQTPTRQCPSSAPSPPQGSWQLQAPQWRGRPVSAQRLPQCSSPLPPVATRRSTQSTSDRS